MLLILALLAPACSPASYGAAFPLQDLDSERAEAVQRARAESIELGGENWEAHEFGELFILTQADERHAKHVAAQAAAMLDWFDEFMPSVAPDGYVRPPIIRIFADWETEDQFRDKVGGETRDGWEILTHKDDEGSSGYEFSWLNRELFEHWIYERDADLYGAFPAWLWDGSRRYVEAGRMKNRKLSFLRDSWDRDEVRMLSRRGELSPLKNLVRLTFDQWNDNPDDDEDHEENREIEASAFVDFLLSKDAARNKRSKGLFLRYVESLGVYVDENRAAVHKGAEAKEKDDPEKGWDSVDYVLDAWNDLDASIVQGAFDGAFAEWKDKDWTTLEKTYLKAIR